MIDTFSLLQKYTGISKYSQSEVITPQNIVKDMVDLLPQEVFNPNATFFDPAVKSGRFLIEIYNRLMASEAMKLAFSNEQDRSKHILANQLYGFATSSTAATVVRKALYNDPLVTGNIHFTSGKVTKELVHGAFNIMKFDVVIGNPPYNKGADLDFIDMGFELSTQYSTMVVPAKWQTAEASQRVASKMTYGEFRKKIVPHMSKVVFYPDAHDVFSISQVDGITYFLLEKDTMIKQCIVENRCSMQKYFNSIERRSIRAGESLHNIGNEIIEYLTKYPRFKFGTVGGRYQVWINSKIALGGNDAQNNVHILSENTGSCQCIGKCRIIDTNDASSMASKIVDSNLAFASDSIHDCNSFVSWVNTKFTRFFVLMNISKLNNVICDACFRFVPAPPSGKFDHIYTDDELYKDFHLPQKYIDVIEAVVKERK